MHLDPHGATARWAVPLLDHGTAVNAVFTRNAPSVDWGKEPLGFVDIDASSAAPQFAVVATRVPEFEVTLSWRTFQKLCKSQEINMKIRIWHSVAVWVGVTLYLLLFGAEPDTRFRDANGRFERCPKCESTNLAEMDQDDGWWTCICGHRFPIR